MRLTLVMMSAQAGGAERVMSLLANHWAARGEEITLITLDSRLPDFYDFDPKVERVRLDLVQLSAGLFAALVNNARRFRNVRAAIVASRPEAVISFLDVVNLLVIASTRFLDVPVIVSERTDPLSDPDLDPLRRRLRPFIYRFADALVVQTERVAEWARGFLPPWRVRVIANPVAVEDRASAETTHPRPAIVAMGRMHPSKGFDLLIEAFARIAAKHPQWSLIIAGDGPRREEYAELIRAREVEHRTTLCGIVSSPATFFAGADLFVLSSRCEGFPNVLLEAMAAGLPVISFDCPSGPAEIIRDNVDGALVPNGDIDALAAAMDRLMESPEERRRLGQRAGEVLDRFSIDRVAREWQSLIASVRLEERA